MLHEKCARVRHPITAVIIHVHGLQMSTDSGRATGTHKICKTCQRKRLTPKWRRAGTPVPGSVPGYYQQDRSRYHHTIMPGMIAAPVTGKCRDSRVVHLPKGIEDGARKLELRTVTVRVCVVVTA